MIYTSFIFPINILHFNASGKYTTITNHYEKYHAMHKALNMCDWRVLKYDKHHQQKYSRFKLQTMGNNLVRSILFMVQKKSSLLRARWLLSIFCFSSSTHVYKTAGLWFSTSTLNGLWPFTNQKLRILLHRLQNNTRSKQQYFIKVWFLHQIHRLSDALKKLTEWETYFQLSIVSYASNIVMLANALLWAPSFVPCSQRLLSADTNLLSSSSVFLNSEIPFSPDLG